MVNKANCEDVIYVDTEAVKKLSNDLSEMNFNLDKKYKMVEDAIKLAKFSWDGPASKEAFSKYESIKKAYYTGDESLKKILDEYVRLLRDAVALDYEVTEANNVKLSEMFK